MRAGYKGCTKSDKIFKRVLYLYNHTENRSKIMGLFSQLLNRPAINHVEPAQVKVMMGVIHNPALKPVADEARTRLERVAQALKSLNP
jgi:hypothetical protein